MFILFVLLGIFVGFLAGLLGIGGGLIVLPSLIFVFRYMTFPEDSLMQMAIATSLASMLFTAGSSAFAHLKKQKPNWQILQVLTPSIILGTLFGALIVEFLPSYLLQKMIGLLLLLIGCYFLFSKEESKNKKTFKFNSLQLVLIGLFIGTLSATLGIGGGIVTVPILTYLGIVLPSAIALSAITGFIIALFGSLSFILVGFLNAHPSIFGNIYLPAFFLIGIPAALMAPIGAYYSHVWPVKYLKIILGLMQITVAIYLLTNFKG